MYRQGGNVLYSTEFNTTYPPNILLIELLGCCPCFFRAESPEGGPWVGWAWWPCKANVLKLLELFSFSPTYRYGCSGYLSNTDRLCNSLMDQSRRQYWENSWSVKLLAMKPQHECWSGCVLVAGWIPGKWRWNAVVQDVHWGRLPLGAFHEITQNQKKKPQTQQAINKNNKTPNQPTSQPKKTKTKQRVFCIAQKFCIAQRHSCLW